MLRAPCIASRVTSSWKASALGGACISGAFAYSLWESRSNSSLAPAPTSWGRDAQQPFNSRALRCDGAASGPRLRLIVSDLDGTLLNDQGYVTEPTKDVLRDVVSDQCPLVLATARGIMERIPYEDLPGPLYLLALGGAHGLVRCPGRASGDPKKDFCELFLEGLSETHARAAVLAAEAEHATVWVFQTDRVFVRLGSLGAAESSAQLDKFIPNREYVQVVDDFDDVLAANRTVEVTAVMPDTDRGASQIQDTLAKAGVDLDVLSMAPDPLVSIKAPGVDKASALQRVCSRLGISPEEVVAFGDGTNDVPMMRFVGHGVAVANARPRLKQCARAVSELTNQGGAVAHELLKLRAEGRL